MEIINLTVLNWNKHNPNLKKTHKKFLLYSGFFQDTAISVLKNYEALFYIFLLCRCCEKGSDSITIAAKSIPKSLRIDGKSLLKCVERLEEFQLVRRNFKALIEENRIEEKRKELNTIITVPKRSVRRQSAPLVSPANLEELISLFDKETIKAWSDLYPDKEYLRRQATKAWEWYRLNPIKKPKKLRGWVTVLNHWFESDWPKHLKSIPSNQVSSYKGIEEIQMEKEQERIARERNSEGE